MSGERNSEKRLKKTLKIEIQGKIRSNESIEGKDRHSGSDWQPKSDFAISRSESDFFNQVWMPKKHREVTL